MKSCFVGVLTLRAVFPLLFAAQRDDRSPSIFEWLVLIQPCWASFLANVCGQVTFRVVNKLPLLKETSKGGEL